MARLVDGYEADPDEVRMIMAAMFDEEEQREPMLLYMVATKMLALHEAVADELRVVRAQAVQRLTNDSSYQAVADLLGMHKSRVGALVQDAKKAAENTSQTRDERT